MNNTEARREYLSSLIHKLHGAPVPHLELIAALATEGKELEENIEWAERMVALYV